MDLLPFLHPDSPTSSPQVAPPLAPLPLLVLACLLLLRLSGRVVWFFLLCNHVPVQLLAAAAVVLAACGVAVC